MRKQLKILLRNCPTFGFPAEWGEATIENRFYAFDPETLELLRGIDNAHGDCACYSSRECLVFESKDIGDFCKIAFVRDKGGASGFVGSIFWFSLEEAIQSLITLKDIDLCIYIDDASGLVVKKLREEICHKVLLSRKGTDTVLTTKINDVPIFEKLELSIDEMPSLNHGFVLESELIEDMRITIGGQLYTLAPCEDKKR
jgi:hypothetical protein